MHANPSMLLLACIVKEISKKIACLVVRLEVKLSSLGRAHPIFCCASYLEGHHGQVEGHIKKFSAGAFRHFMPLHFQFVSGATDFNR